MRYVIAIVCCVTFLAWDIFLNDGHAIYVTVRELRRLAALIFGI